MSTTYRNRPVTEAIITALSDAALLVGDGEKPDTGGWTATPSQSPFVPYVVVHPLGAYEIDGTIGDSFADVWPLHQITAYGATRAQCEETADNVRHIMLTSALVIADRKVCIVEPDLLGIVSRVDDVQPPLYMAPDRYMVCTTPR